MCTSFRWHCLVGGCGCRWERGGEGGGPMDKTVWLWLAFLQICADQHTHSLSIGLSVSMILCFVFCQRHYKRQEVCVFASDIYYGPAGIVPAMSDMEKSAWNCPPTITFTFSVNNHNHDRGYSVEALSYFFKVFFIFFSLYCNAIWLVFVIAIAISNRKTTPL